MNLRPLKIGVLRANALGDFILTLPALEALKHSFPEAELVLIGRKLHREFLDERKGPVDRTIPLPSAIQFNESLSVEDEETKEQLNLLRGEKFDLVLQLHGGGKYSNAFVNMMAPRLSAGAKTPDAPTLHLNLPYCRYQHEILRQREIIERVGAKPQTLSPFLSTSKEETERAQRFLFEITGSEGPFVLVNPGATDARRRWPVENFAEVSRELIKRGYKILINIGPGEEDLGEVLAQLTVNNTEVFKIHPSLKELPGILKCCALIISNDTGTMHLAMALQLPTVALFWYGNLLNYGPLIRGKTKVLVSKEATCPACLANYFDEERCPHSHSIVSSISCPEVMEASAQLLEL